jgi:hypothetical protein
MLHQRGEQVGRQFSRDPTARVAEYQLAESAEWLQSGALISGEAVRSGTAQACDVVCVETTWTDSDVRVKAVHDLRKIR